MQVDFRKGLRHVAPLSSVTVRSNGPFRADVCWCIYAPGLWPGLAETAFQAENLVEILLVRSNKKWRCPTKSDNVWLIQIDVSVQDHLSLQESASVEKNNHSE